MGLSKHFAGLSLADGRETRWLLVCASVAIAVFIWTAQQLASNSSLHAWDIEIAAAVQGTRTPGLTAAMTLLTNLNSNLAINLYTTTIALYWAASQAWREVALWLWIVPGGLLFNYALKQLFARARPPALDALLSVSSYSFPSGHMTGATLFYGCAALVLGRDAQHRALSYSFIALALALAMLTGLSRIYLGLHFFSDVIGGFCLGCAWLCLSLWAGRELLGCQSSPRN